MTCVAQLLCRKSNKTRKNTTLTIDDIPDEVLELVFFKLSLSDRKSSRLVSHRWLAVSTSTRITATERLVIKLKDLRPMMIARKNLHLEIIDDVVGIKDPSLQLEQLEFWLKHGSSVQSLNVVERKQNCLIVDNIIDYCPNVVTISFLFSRGFRAINFENTKNELYVGPWRGEKDDGNDYVGPKLECLTSLSISGGYSFHFVTGAGFMRLTKSVPNLKRLEVHGINTEERRMQRYHDEAILALISKQSLTLTQLVYEWRSVPIDGFLERFLQLIGPQLNGVHLKFVALWDIVCLNNTEKQLPNLESLELFNDPLQDRMPWLLLHFENLKFISFSHCPMSDDQLLSLGNLKNLKGLNISGTQCSAEGISECFGRRMYPNLIALEMDCLNVNDEALANILPNLSSIKFLSLKGCGEITTRGVQEIITNCKQLTHLYLPRCTKIQDIIDPISINSLVNLVELNLSDCLGLNRGNFAQLRLDKLKCLGLEGLFSTDQDVADLKKNCPKLARVYLRRSDLENFTHRDLAWNVDTSGQPTILSIFNFSKN